MSAIRLRLYGISPQDGTQEHNSAQWRSNISQTQQRYSTGHFSLLTDSCFWAGTVVLHGICCASYSRCLRDALGNLLPRQETSTSFLQDKQLLGESDVGSLLESINCSLMLLRKACLVWSTSPIDWSNYLPRETANWNQENKQLEGALQKRLSDVSKPATTETPQGDRHDTCVYRCHPGTGNSCLQPEAKKIQHTDKDLSRLVGCCMFSTFPQPHISKTSQWYRRNKLLPQRVFPGWLIHTYDFSSMKKKK